MDLMLDLETLATCPTAAVIQIGACFFDPRSTTTGMKFHINVSLLSCVLAGLVVDPKTVDWWRGRENGHLQNDQVPLEKALASFTKWYQSYADVSTRVWSHGLSFDVPIMNHLYHISWQEPPWNYRLLRDTRTLFEEAEELGWQKPSHGEPAHQALHDAVQQAQDVQAAVFHRMAFQSLHKVLHANLKAMKEKYE